jgi:hypothetical protein
MPYKVTELFAFIAIDKDGDEAVPAFSSGMYLLPLMGADTARIDSIRPMAQQIADMTGRHMRLVKFSHMELVEEIFPK